MSEYVLLTTSIRGDIITTILLSQPVENILKKEDKQIMYLAGLIFTLIGWVFQLYETVVKKSRSINIVLPLSYFIGCILFGVNSLQLGDMLFAIIDFVCALLVGIIFIVLIRNK